jgi:L-lactate dehydrogenase
MLCKGTGVKLTLTDVDAAKAEAEVLDLEDSGGSIDVATFEEAGQADVILITAGRGRQKGETRLDLLEDNAEVVKSAVIAMRPIKKTAKILVVTDPCDPLTCLVQRLSGLSVSQVFGIGTQLDSRRLRVDLASQLDIHHSSIIVFVLGEHGDSQFPVPSLANVGGVPLVEHVRMKDVNLEEVAKRTASKACGIIAQKGFTAFGIATGCQKIVDCILNDRKLVLPLSVRVEGRGCCLSLPVVLGINGVEQLLDVEKHFDATEKQRFDASIERVLETTKRMESIVGSLG